MERAEEKKMQIQKVEDKSSSKAIRVSLKHQMILKKGRDEINRDSTYKKKISITRYVEKLIEDYWDKSIEDLKKEREGAKDWLEVEYKREAPNMSFYDWLKFRVQSNLQKKEIKRNSGGSK